MFRQQALLLQWQVIGSLSFCFVFLHLEHLYYRFPTLLSRLVFKRTNNLFSVSGSDQTNEWVVIIDFIAVF